ncbi:vitellogenin receptor Yl-like isoform 2-T2 [Pholidichthys leucotaenia]
MGHAGHALILIAPLLWLHVRGDVYCKKDEFSCRSRCIPMHFICNGEDDCGDGSDEAFCLNCTADFFSCGPSDTCLPRNKLCDGSADCKDGRDETPEVCPPQTSASCAPSEFECRNGHCIRQTWRCDSSSDCADGSDEDNCDQDECQINNGGCSHSCVDQPMGFFCECPDNMRLIDDTQCEEIDACLESDLCDQLCVHINGSFTCDCHKGYRMNPGTGECKAKGPEAQLIFTTSKGIELRRINDTEYKVVASQVPGPGPLAVIAAYRTLYWAQRGSIYRISMDGPPQKPVMVLKVEGSVSSLAVDWIHLLLYWTNAEKGLVSIAPLDGSIQHQLISGLHKPSAVVVDPVHGLLFWAQCGSSPKIERALLDGRDRMALVTSLIRHPVALSLDMPRQLLYWFDEGMRSISRVNLEGRHRKIVVESNGYLDHSFGLTVFEGFVYWSEEVTRSICRANKQNGSSVCGRLGTVCHHKCIVDLLSESPEFSCSSPKTRLNKSQEIPDVSHRVPPSTLSDPTLAGVLALIMFLGVLLLGTALWWWKQEFRPSRSQILQSISLKESQDPLIIHHHGTHMCANTCMDGQGNCASAGLGQ